MQNLKFGVAAAKPPQLTRAAAETLAIEALSFLAADRERLDRFLALSGIGLENLQAAAAAAGFLAAILDHLATEETLLLAFAADAGQRPEDIVKARDILSPPLQAS